jgi:hypothetical protein
VNYADLVAQLDELSDSELVHHGFTTYMRDYELVVFRSTDPRSGIAPRHLRFLFRCCPEASVRSGLAPALWSRSMDDQLLEQHHVTVQSSGYVWGVQCQELYPGAAIAENSERARWWSEQVGVPFHEVEVLANAHQIRIIFTGLQVEEVSAGWTPFEIGKTGIAEEYAAASKIPPASHQPPSPVP